MMIKITYLQLLFWSSAICSKKCEYLLHVYLLYLIIIIYINIYGYAFGVFWIHLNGAKQERDWNCQLLYEETKVIVICQNDYQIDKKYPDKSEIILTFLSTKAAYVSAQSNTLLLLMGQNMKKSSGPL